MLVVGRVDDTDVGREGLLQAGGDLVGVRRRVVGVRVEVERNVGGVATLLGAEVDGDDALVVGVEAEVEEVLMIFNFLEFDVRFADVDVVLEHDDLRVGSIFGAHIGAAAAIASAIAGSVFLSRCSSPISVASSVLIAHLTNILFIYFELL